MAIASTALTEKTCRRSSRRSCCSRSGSAGRAGWDSQWPSGVTHPGTASATPSAASGSRRRVKATIASRVRCPDVTATVFSVTTSPLAETVASRIRSRSRMSATMVTPVSLAISSSVPGAPPLETRSPSPSRPLVSSSLAMTEIVGRLSPTRRDNSARVAGPRVMMDRSTRLRLIRRASCGSAGTSSGRNGEDPCVLMVQPCHVGRRTVGGCVSSLRSRRSIFLRSRPSE